MSYDERFSENLSFRGKHYIYNSQSRWGRDVRVHERRMCVCVSRCENCIFFQMFTDTNTCHVQVPHRLTEEEIHHKNNAQSSSRSREPLYSLLETAHRNISITLLTGAKVQNSEQFDLTDLSSVFMYSTVNNLVKEIHQFC